MKWTTQKGLPGHTFQQGMNTVNGGRPTLLANGLVLVGTVIATYVSDDPDNASKEKPPNRVYCDVMVFSTFPAIGTRPLFRVPCCIGGGLHGGTIYAPRAAKIDVTGEEIKTFALNPTNLDGDQVLIQFLDGNLQLPIITSLAPHLRQGLGNENQEATIHRQTLRQVDGHPLLQKHMGSGFGIDKDGNFLIDTRRAHSGEYSADGHEVPKDDEEHGNVTLNLAPKATLHAIGMAVDGTGKTFEIEAKDNSFLVKLQDGASLDLSGKDNDAILAIGSGTVHAAIFEELKTWWDTVAFPTMQALGDSQVHPSAMGPTGPGVPPYISIKSAMMLPETIKSTKIKMGPA